MIAELERELDRQRSNAVAVSQTRSGRADREHDVGGRPGQADEQRLAAGGCAGCRGFTGTGLAQPKRAHPRPRAAAGSADAADRIDVGDGVEREATRPLGGVVAER